MITRAEAKAKGLKRYFNGNPCKHGHVAERRTSTGLCIECSRRFAREAGRAALADAIKHANILHMARQWRAGLAPDRKKRRDERNAEWQRQYYALPENRAKRAAWARRRYQEDPARDIARVHKRRFLKEKNGGEYTSKDVSALHKYQGGKCAYCRVKFGKYHVDHIVPLVLGGANDKANLQLLCPPCNRSKGALHPAEFARNKFGLLI